MGRRGGSRNYGVVLPPLLLLLLTATTEIRMAMAATESRKNGCMAMRGNGGVGRLNGFAHWTPTNKMLRKATHVTTPKSLPQQLQQLGEGKREMRFSSQNKSARMKAASLQEWELHRRGGGGGGRGSASATAVLPPKQPQWLLEQGKTSNALIATFAQEITTRAGRDETKRNAASPLDSSGGTPQNSNNSGGDMTSLDAALFVTYLCNACIMALPVTLLPVISADAILVGTGGGVGVGDGAAASSLLQQQNIAAFSASLASAASLGSGGGKAVNGFLCKGLGGQTSATVYLVGLAVGSTALASMPPTQAGWALMGLGFGTSMGWTACNLVLANHYFGRDEPKFAQGLQLLSLASSLGVGLCKVVTTVLLQSLTWRQVSTLGAIVSLVGATVAFCFLPEYPDDTTTTAATTSPKSTLLPPLPKGEEKEEATENALSSVLASIQTVLGNPLFWQVGFGHAIAMIARTSDQVLGAFFHDISGLPRSICGGLTMSITIGFVWGLLSGGKEFGSKTKGEEKRQFLQQRYGMATLACLGLALVPQCRRFCWWASPLDWGTTFLDPVEWLSQHSITLMVLGAGLACSLLLAYSVSFQCYNLPVLFGNARMSQEKSVSLSLMDCLGYLLSAALWQATSLFVKRGGGAQRDWVGTVSQGDMLLMNWSVTWAVIAALIAVGGFFMVEATPSFLLPSSSSLSNSPEREDTKPYEKPMVHHRREERLLLTMKKQQYGHSRHGTQKRKQQP